MWMYLVHLGGIGYRKYIESHLIDEEIQRRVSQLPAAEQDAARQYLNTQRPRMLRAAEQREVAERRWKPIDYVLCYFFTGAAILFVIALKYGG
jgi:hypothetical protein